MKTVTHSRIPALSFFERYVQQNANTLHGKIICDLSCGTGYIANLFLKKNAKVMCYDLFPEQCQYPDLLCQKIDLQLPLPIESNMADVVILSETIEHLPNQFLLLAEISRILKPEGKFLLTTPNPSSLRSRFAQFIGESEHYSKPFPDETNAYVKWPGTNNAYFNKIFISGVLRIRLLAVLNGMVLQKIHRCPYSFTSLLLMIFYPLIYFFSIKNYRKKTRENPHNAPVYKEIFRLNTSLNILLGKHLIVEFKKT
ncbi:MAG: class I SAM-dependent methyltransferase [Cytophagaceae bacterium]|nr:class I SAM-dependent methyltransferase [Cytophagaceae bacterium]MDW8455883.1 class I SAM-dependent methyltransferase [Cytophagaceae bacterium]